MSPPLQRHPRFAELLDAFLVHPEWFMPWTGTVFRFQSIDYPSQGDVLSGMGAGHRGGRWNPPGLRAIYGSTTDTTALEECRAHDRYYGVQTRSPRLLVAIEARLPQTLALVNPAIRRPLGVTSAELAHEDWRKVQNSGRESLTQAIGRALATSGGSGLLARSAADRLGVTVVMFPGCLATGHLMVVEGERLDRWTGQAGV